MVQVLSCSRCLLIVCTSRWICCSKILLFVVASMYKCTSLLYIHECSSSSKCAHQQFVSLLISVKIQSIWSQGMKLLSCEVTWISNCRKWCCKKICPCIGYSRTLLQHVALLILVCVCVALGAGFTAICSFKIAGFCCVACLLSLACSSCSYSSHSYHTYPASFWNG